jgi:hypothetical protein
MMQLTRRLVLLAALGAAAATGASGAWAADQSSGTRSGEVKSGPPATAAAQHVPRIEGGQVNGHWREGTRLIDQPGQFKITGDRVSFISSDGSLRFECLENLCGQRIARMVADSPETLIWSVTGDLSEYRGVNFLLLTQAVLKPRSPRSAAAP